MISLEDNPSTKMTIIAMDSGSSKVYSRKTTSSLWPIFSLKYSKFFARSGKSPAVSWTYAGPFSGRLALFFVFSFPTGLGCRKPPAFFIGYGPSLISSGQTSRARLPYSAGKTFFPFSATPTPTGDLFAVYDYGDNFTTVRAVRAFKTFDSDFPVG